MIDPITLILTALAVGASKGVGDTASSTVKEAYEALKSLVRRRLGQWNDEEVSDPSLDGSAVLDRYERTPEVWRGPLQEILTSAGLESDAEVAAAAKRLMELAEPREAAAGKYTVRIDGDVHGLAQGDGQTVTMNFGTGGGPEERRPNP